MGAVILVVEDDKSHLTMLQTVLKGWKFGVKGAEDGEQAVSLVRDRPYDAVLMDVRMAGIGGIEALRQIKEYNPAIPVIIMTAYSSVDSAVEAMKLGAYDYLTKPLNFEELKLTLERALEHMHLAKENKSLKKQIASKDLSSQIIGSSTQMQELNQMVKVVAPTEATVLLTGESGTGKGLIAKAIHKYSERCENELVTVNCAALTETLLESELFGHEKGAFTGAEKRRDGKFMLADKGTIFLDEIAEIPLTMQAKLLRVIQDREIQRLGSDTALKVDVRIIAATNRELEQEVQEGRFREDLYYRLNVVNLKVPALREHAEDIPALANKFALRFAEKNRKKIKGLTPLAMDMLVKYSWPGNVRELQNALERAVILAMDEYISEKELSPAIIQGYKQAEVKKDSGKNSGSSSLEEVEKQAIISTLEKTGGNKSEAARILNITRTTLHNKLRKYDIEVLSDD